MHSNSIYFPEDIWGELKYITIPEPDIYFLCGRQVEGYAVPQNYTGTVISKMALSFGVIQGEMLYFPSGKTMNIIEFELVRHQLQNAQNETEKSFLQEERAILSSLGELIVSAILERTHHLICVIPVPTLMYQKTKDEDYCANVESWCLQR